MTRILCREPFIPLDYFRCFITLRKQATIHQLTTMLATSQNVLFPGHSHLLTTGPNDPGQYFNYHPSTSECNKGKGHQDRWLADNYAKIK